MVIFSTSDTKYFNDTNIKDVLKSVNETDFGPLDPFDPFLSCNAWVNLFLSHVFVNRYVMVHHRMNFSFVLKSVIDHLFWPFLDPSYVMMPGKINS